MNKQNRFLSSLLGYGHDLSRLARAVPINPHSQMKYLALRGLARRTGAGVLIETGTCLGVTSARCARVFERVLTIELDSELAASATRYLRHLRNVEVFQGDAVEILPQLMERNDALKVVVFLDGHFSGGNTALGDVPEPALLELKVLARHIDRICGIIVDDFRLFGIEPGFPNKADLVTSVERLFAYPSFEIKVHADQLIVERRQTDGFRPR